MAEARQATHGAAKGALHIAVLGAECTGKTELVLELRRALVEHTGQRVAAVPEYLREWCDQRLRTPTRQEQSAIAAEQQRRIDEAGATHEIVVCDTTPLMTAIYSQWYFGDLSLDAPAIEAQRAVQLTLVTALDVPWQPDGHQRDGDHVRAPIDALLRATLARHSLPFQVVSGLGGQRLVTALALIRPWLGP